MRATRPASPHTDRVLRAGLLTALFVALLWADQGSARPRDFDRSALEATVAAHFAADGGTTAVVHVSLPYRLLVFKRDGERYASRLRVSVVAKAGGERVGGGFAQVEVVTADYADTRTDERIRCAVDVPLSVQSELELEVRATIAGTSRTWERDLRFDPGAVGDVPYHFTGFHWNLVAGEEGYMVGADTDTLSAVLTLAAHPLRDEGSARADLQVLVRNPQDQERILHEERLTRASADTLVVRVRVPVSRMPFGPLVLTARVTADDGAALELTPGRDFVNLAVPFGDEAAWRRHVGWLETIVDADGRRVLAGTSPAGRPAAWRRIWDQRPVEASPTETEHLLRIVTADRRFGRFGRGALSDQGRVLIHHGEPDRVETVEMDASYPGTWQIWYYRALGLLFRFYDAYGLGDFRLYDTALY